MRTDWSKRTDPAKFLNMKEDGPHVPGPSAATVHFLVEQRNVNGWGVEAVGTDAGQAFAFEPAFPAHHLMHGANKFGLASLTNLDQLARHRRGADHRPAEDRARLRQPAAGAGAGSPADRPRPIAAPRAGIRAERLVGLTAYFRRNRVLVSPTLGKRGRVSKAERMTQFESNEEFFACRQASD